MSTPRTAFVARCAARFGWYAVGSLVTFFLLNPRLFEWYDATSIVIAAVGALGCEDGFRVESPR